MSKLLIGVLVLALAAAAFFFWQTQQPRGEALGPYKPEVSNSPTINSAETENWKTYTNNKYGYTLSYPTEMHIVELKDGGAVYLTLRKQTDDTACNDTGIAIISDDNFVCGSLHINQKTITSSETIAGKKINSTTQFLNGNPIETIFESISNDSHRFVIKYFISSEDYPEISSLTATFKQILSTFNFL